MSRSSKVKSGNTIGAKIQPKTHRHALAKFQRNAPTRGATKLGGSAEGGVGKLAYMIAMLRRPKGATIEQIMTATGWQAHSVRGAISGALKKKRGLTVTSAAESGGTRVYRIAG